MMPSSLTHILFSNLLGSPAIVEITARVLEKAVPIIKEHFTFTADEITKAYQNACSYSFVAISIGLDAPDSLLKKVRYPKITREFAHQIEITYFKPFCEQNDIDGLQSVSFVKPLKKWAYQTDKLFEIKEITEDDLSALIGHQQTVAISDLILAQMEKIELVDETLAAFLRFNNLLGDSVLFFFREQFRKDARIQATQTALQQERLCIEVKNIQATLDDLKETQEKHPFLTEQISQQVQHLQQWQIQHERFQNRFAEQLDEVLDWAQAVYANLAEIQEDVKETKAEVKETKILAEEILQKLTDLMARQDLAPQIKPRDEFTQHNSTSLKLIREALTLFKQLPTQAPEYSRVSILVGSALSSSGELAQAQKCLQQAIETANNDAEKALAHFNLFQVQLRCKAYQEAFSNLQVAIQLEAERYALHDTHKYPPKRLLGAGGMGCVFLCNNQNYLLEAQQVVVKCFWENLTGTLNEVFKEPFLMRDIAGNYIPKPLDFGYAAPFKQQRAYFVTEYLEDAIDGETWLETYGAMDLELGLSVGLQIAKGLQIAHDAGIYHLDLKPANILLKKTKVSISVKIIDFGLSQVTYSLRQEANVQQNRSGLSQLGQAIFGTLDYAPPEQRGYIDYGKPSAQSDIFAFGKTMYRLLTKEVPLEIEPEALEHAPDWLKLLSSCTRANPAKRPKSAQQLVSRLTEMEEARNTKSRKQAEIAKQKAEIEAEQKRQAEIAEQKAEEERKRKAEEEKKRQAEIAQQKVEEERKRKAEEEKKRQAEIAKQKAEEQRQTKLANYRYIDNGNGTVTDNRTGLIWLKNANCFGAQNWKTAMQSAAQLADGQCGLSDGSKPGDWRLPTKDEWQAMVDNKYENPALSNATGTSQWTEGDAFSGVQTNYYWSSATNAYYASSAWGVFLYNGYVFHNVKSLSNYVWPVRGGGQ